MLGVLEESKAAEQRPKNMDTDAFLRFVGGARCGVGSMPASWDG